MQHIHSVVDTDTRFIINPITRQIRNETSRKTSLMQNDHNSERFTFELPRYIENHDMSHCNKVEIHYLNSSARDKETFHKGLYTVTDLKVSEDDPEKVVLSWLISNNATQLVGKLSFRIHFKCIENDIITYAWHTAIFADITISDGINADESFEMEYVDIIEQWKYALKREVAEEVNANVTEWADMESGRVRGEMTSFSAQWNDALNVERNRINNIVALPNGSTTGDAELLDIRVGADGVTYDSAGTAVREQFSTIHNVFEECVNLFDKHAVTLNKFAFGEELADGDGFYVSDFIEVKPSTFYIIPCTASVLATFYDADKVYLERAKREHYAQPYESCSIFKPNASTKYVRVNGYIGNETASVPCPLSEYMLVEGTVYPSHYIAYNELKPTVKQKCLNLDVHKWNALYGKTLMTLGDSITEGSNIETSAETGYKMTYGGIVAYRNSMAFINKGWGGGTIADDGRKPFVHNGEIYIDLGGITPDYLTIWYGWNDFARDAISLGDIDSVDESTYYGAWNVALNLLIHKYPLTKIGIVVPYGMNAEWRQAVRNVAQKWGIPYMDLYDNQSCIFDNEFGVIPLVSKLRKDTLLDDGTHPNAVGYEWLSTIYEAFLRRL